MNHPWLILSYLVIGWFFSYRYLRLTNPNLGDQMNLRLLLAMLAAGASLMGPFALIPYGRAKWKQYHTAAAIRQRVEDARDQSPCSLL